MFSTSVSFGNITRRRQAPSWCGLDGQCLLV